MEQVCRVTDNKNGPRISWSVSWVLYAPAALSGSLIWAGRYMVIRETKGLVGWTPA